MPQETEAKIPSNAFRTGVFVLFLLGALLSGLDVFFKETPQPMVQRVVTGGKPIGTEWSEFHFRDGHVPFEAWAGQQQALTQRLDRFLSRKLELQLVYTVSPLIFQTVKEFDDFMVRPGFPLAGSVIRLTDGPQCVAFGWSQMPINAVEYTLEISKDRDFRYSKSFGAKKNGMKIRIGTSSDYFWRVTASSPKHRQTSETSSFLVLEPTLSEDEKKKRDDVRRVILEDAWMGDVAFCSGSR